MITDFWLFTDLFSYTCSKSKKIVLKGYFGAWGMAVFATMALGVNAATVHNTASTAGPMAGLFASSVLVLIAISTNGIKAGQSFFAELVYSLLVALLSILFSGASLKGMDAMKPFMLPGTVVFAVLWIVAACLLTFRGPFLMTGNGYFGAWGGALTSAFVANAARIAAAGDT
jgi:hypothetical protein